MNKAIEGKHYLEPQIYTATKQGYPQFLLDILMAAKSQKITHIRLRQTNRRLGKY